MRVGHRWIFVIAMVLGACAGGDSTAPPEPPARRGIQFISGNNVTDTAGAILSEPLVVEVHDSTGKLAPFGSTVLFDAVSNASRTVFETFVQAIGSSSFNVVASGTTDASGRTAVRVRLGLKVGNGRVAISVPTLGLRDTARLMVILGASASVAIEPQDTAVYVGRSYALRGRATDRYGNVRSDTLTWRASGLGISVTSAGQLTANAIGRYTITASTSSATATVALTVIPSGRLATVRSDSGLHIAVADLDGSNVHKLAQIAIGNSGAYPMWIPGTNRIVYASWEGPFRILRTVDESGIGKQFLVSAPPNVSEQAEPAPTANGQWVYFSAIDDRCSGAATYCLYRARSDGSDAELLSDSIQQTALTLRPAPSPDGAKVAFVGRDQSGLAVIKVFDVATRTAVSLGVRGQNPRWSPNGSQIAFLQYHGGPIMLMNADGTGARALTEPGNAFLDYPLSWSPDGQFIIAQGDGSFNVVVVSSGVTLPLPYSYILIGASFK